MIYKFDLKKTKIKYLFNNLSNLKREKYNLTKYIK